MQFRRQFALQFVAVALTGCRESQECTDTTGLTAAESELRLKSLKYVDESPEPMSSCATCQQCQGTIT